MMCERETRIPRASRFSFYTNIHVKVIKNRLLLLILILLPYVVFRQLLIVRDRREKANLPFTTALANHFLT